LDDKGSNRPSMGKIDTVREKKERGERISFKKKWGDVRGTASKGLKILLGEKKRWVTGMLLPKLWSEAHE